MQSFRKQQQGSTTSSGWLKSLRGTLGGLLTQSYLIIFLLVALVVGFIATPAFLTVSNLENIVITASVVAVLAVGEFIVIVTRGIDLSVGSVAALGTVVVASLLQQGWPLVIAVILTLVACGTAGLINGTAVVYAGITPFIATFAMLSIARGVAYVAQPGSGLIEVSNTTFLTLFAGSILGIPSGILILLFVAFVAAFMMKFTTFGRQLYAIGGNPEAARLSGLPVNRNLIIAYVSSGMLAGVGGLMLAAQLQQGSSLVGVAYELEAIAAAVVGGTSLFGGIGNPISAVLGALLIGIIGNIMNLLGIQSEPQAIILGIVILVAVFFTTAGGLQRLARAFRGIKDKLRG